MSIPIFLFNTNMRMVRRLVHVSCQVVIEVKFCLYTYVFMYLCTWTWYCCITGCRLTGRPICRVL